jgi:hypothetical protein
MNEAPSVVSKPDNSQLNLRTLLKRESPYILMVVLALFGMRIPPFRVRPWRFIGSPLCR